MAVRVVVGAQWGDEGKGKIVDLLSNRADYVVRYQGGANAGHTLKFDDQKIVLHLIPSGMFNGDSTCVIGNGVVADPYALLNEIEEVEALGANVKERLKISKAAHVILPYHQLLDKVKEEHRGEDAIGTTGRGIGPAYESKVSRVGVRMSDLFHPDKLRQKVETNVANINDALEHVYNHQPVKPGPIIDELLDAAEKLRPFITNTRAMLHQAVANDDEILLEGAQGSLLDVEHGTYPYVTSSCPTSGGASTGSGIPPTAIDKVMGISKAYCTRVGHGPFPTELQGDMGEMLRSAGQEFGATTGRPRRCGWIDLVALKYAVQLNGMNELALTKLDILNDFEQIKLCTAYEINGEQTEVFPADLPDVDSINPVYKTMPGWQASLEDCTTINGLPTKARNFIDFVKEYLGVELTILSKGPKRSETIEL